MFINILEENFSNKLFENKLDFFSLKIKLNLEEGSIEAYMFQRVSFQTLIIT